MSQEPVKSSDDVVYRIGLAGGVRTRPIQMFDPAVLDVDHTYVAPAGQTPGVPFTDEANVIYNRSVFQSDIQSAMNEADYADRHFSDLDRNLNRDGG